MHDFLSRYQIHPGRIAYIVVVVIGYGVGLVNSLPGISTATIVTTLLLTAVYLFLGLRDDEYFARFPSPLGTTVYFVVQLGLVLTVQLLLDPGASWLMSLPLAGTAVERLRPVGRWPVYLAIVAGMALPLWLRYGWESALFNTFTFSPAIIFVVIFTRLMLAERSARLRAEDLTRRLEDANRQLAAYATQAEELATTKERNRLAREIHDNLGHYLTVVNVQIRAAQAVMAADPDKAQDALVKAQHLTEEGLSAIRQSIAALRESPLGNRPLPDALAALLDETQNSGIVTAFDQHGETRQIDAKAALTLYRAAQEGLTNVRKHARASRVDLRLDYSDPTAVQLTIQDNGVGTAERHNGGFGLLGIAERVQMLGGDMDVDSAPGHGFTLRVRLPA